MESQLDILLVEDDSAQAELFNILLKKKYSAVQMMHFSSGSKLVNSLKEKFPVSSHPTIILSDLNLLDMTGLELLAELRQLPLGYKLRFILFTQMLNHKTLEEAYSKGATAVLSKPNSLDEFDALITALVTFWSLTRPC